MTKISQDAHKKATILHIIEFFPKVDKIYKESFIAKNYCEIEAKIAIKSSVLANLK